LGNNLFVNFNDTSGSSALDDAGRERAETVLRQAFIAAQLGMPSEEPETAVESLWIILEALLVDHLAPQTDLQQSRGDQRTSIENHWRRMVITAVTHTFILGGDFVQPEQLLELVNANARRLADGTLWHTRRPPAQGALVLGVHRSLEALDVTAQSGRAPTVADFTALQELIAFATLGAILPGSDAENSTRVQSEDEPPGRWSKSTYQVAASFGIPEVELLAVSKSGWACSECGCIFLGRVDGGIAYPDRFAPIGRAGACDVQIECGCHSAPLQRRIR